MRRATLFTTCLAENLLPDILKKMVLLMERLGVELSYPGRQTCCGQPFYNSGFATEGRRLAEAWMAAFADSEGPIVAASGSCVEFVKHRYPSLFPPGSDEHRLALEISGRVMEISQYLVNELGVKDVGAYFPHRVACHLPCHLSRGLGVREEPLVLLEQVRGLELVELPEADRCCGFGGIFSVVYPEVSEAMLAAKLKKIISSGAEAVIVSEPGCLMNIRGGLRRLKSTIRALHLVEILSERERP